jgi:hypothetical protein
LVGAAGDPSRGCLIGPWGGQGWGHAIPVPVTVVIATRDRRDELLTTLGHLRALPERPPVIVVDNGSTDGSPLRMKV